MSVAVVKPGLYGLLNVVSASGIVFANKIVLSTFGFHFLSALAFIHTVATVVGMHTFCWAGVFESKRLSFRSILPLAVAFVGYIVLNNLNLRLNTVGFYQLSKLLVAPAVLCAEAVFLGKKASKQVRKRTAPCKAYCKISLSVTRFLGCSTLPGQKSGNL